MFLLYNNVEATFVLLVAESVFVVEEENVLPVQEEDPLLVQEKDCLLEEKDKSACKAGCPILPIKN